MQFLYLIIITIIVLIYAIPLSFSEVRNSIKEQIQSAIMTVKNENGKWVKVSDNIYLDTSSISKTKYLVSGWFKIYDTPEDDLSTIDGVDTPEDDLSTIDGVDVYYVINKYVVSCDEGDDAIFVDHFKYFDKNNNILSDKEYTSRIGCNCRGLVNGELICKELCKRF